MSPLLEVEGLSKYFAIDAGMFSRRGRRLRAVDDVSFSVEERETLGLVGESGCGKSTLGRCLLRLIEPTHGQVRFAGRSVTELDRRQLRELRRELQVVFQDPYSSLNPRMSVFEAIAEPLRVHGLVSGSAALRSRVEELLDRVGLRAESMRRFPHEFSGGQRQRIGIARALAVQPRFIVCDEPVSALDVSVQAQIVNLLKDLSAELGLAYLFIAHDLTVVRYVSRRVAVMYLGRIVELAETAALYETPTHPYTRALLASVPSPDPGVPPLRLPLLGELPSPLNPPSGCAFHPRCPIAEPGLCDREVPPLRELEAGRRVACHLAESPTNVASRGD